jgi:hypothetical protein
MSAMMAGVTGPLQIPQGSAQGIDFAVVGLALSFERFEHFQDGFHFVSGFLEGSDDVVNLVDGFLDGSGRSRMPWMGWLRGMGWRAFDLLRNGGTRF